MKNQEVINMLKEISSVGYCGTYVTGFESMQNLIKIKIEHLEKGEEE